LIRGLLEAVKKKKATARIIGAQVGKDGAYRGRPLGGKESKETKELGGFGSLPPGLLSSEREIKKTIVE